MIAESARPIGILSRFQVHVCETPTLRSPQRPAGAVFVIGFGFYMVPILRARGRVSGTAYEPFNARLLYHLIGSRPDAAALQLARGLPATGRGCICCSDLWSGRRR